MNHKKVYFLTCFMQNIQKPNILGSRALNVWSNHDGPPCIGVLSMMHFGLRETVLPRWPFVNHSLHQNKNFTCKARRDNPPPYNINFKSKFYGF